MRQLRLAEVIANELRTRILSGELQDGDLLSKEADLRDEFRVSKPSLREALRILEAEGILSVQRGKVGGAVVKVPNPSHAAYTLGLVLSAQHVDLADIGVALREVEPICAALCASRPDRIETIVPVLIRIHEESERHVDDLAKVTSLSREFHESIVSQCGNQTLTVVVGALESLWSGFETEWASRQEGGSIPIQERREVLKEHALLISCIEAGDTEKAQEVARHHLARAQKYPYEGNAPGMIDIGATRRRIFG